ncbi:dual specificity protein phosphatase, putative (macronuclear) [Tetrahymena thermophila SB210]|uniref:Dual specificity protein phosphatase, putative n=1 Tax=Tetrahymena thermophila (strain SB210) TaxID=312017 RepID=I7M933_TETTS|nr:dual specificity protein phosphatase, putative [Tetrahymena thermophila SB210]EAS00620.1 dual specificity protein phosphatase, putative [Tetrahymena thermophila SB210]|eukprot:XP_001020865.1 dual specificity protein phosphatase, putative [Tetrahymena thermophila SB210]
MDTQQRKFIYRCKQCRQQLFKKEDIEHEAQTQKDKCTSIYISEEVEWIKNRVAEEWDHNLLCPKCKNKVGEIKLDGLQCRCGEWIIPGIQMSLGKVDKLIDLSSK